MNCCSDVYLNCYGDVHCELMYICTATAMLIDSWCTYKLLPWCWPTADVYNLYILYIYNIATVILIDRWMNKCTYKLLRGCWSTLLMYIWIVLVTLIDSWWPCWLTVVVCVGLEKQSPVAVLTSQNRALWSKVSGHVFSSYVIAIDASLDTIFFYTIFFFH